MYKGKKTLFYNGEILYDEAGGYLIYDQEEQQSWEVIIVLPGVELIPCYTFASSKNIEKVIMADDSVRRIDHYALAYCRSLFFVKLSRNLEYVGEGAFRGCESLTSIFIPLSCTEIGNDAVRDCKKLMILSVPRQTQICQNVIGNTALSRASLFKQEIWGEYDNTDEVNQWVKDINSGREYSLHRICCSTYKNEALPISEAIYQEIKEQGPQVLHIQNKIGITPLKYLEENPYLDNIDEMKILKRYILEKMGQDVVIV
jgi:hypothetical protein